MVCDRSHFANLIVDPMMQSPLQTDGYLIMSEDGGKASATRRFRRMHGDVQATSCHEASNPKKCLPGDETGDLDSLHGAEQWWRPILSDPQFLPFSLDNAGP